MKEAWLGSHAKWINVTHTQVKDLTIMYYNFSFCKLSQLSFDLISLILKYHGDPFGPNCMYSSEDYNSTTSHPPLIGYGLGEINNSLYDGEINKFHIAILFPIYTKIRRFSHIRSLLRRYCAWLFCFSRRLRRSHTFAWYRQLRLSLSFSSHHAICEYIREWIGCWPKLYSLHSRTIQMWVVF